MLRLFFDQNFNHRILRGLLKQIPNLDFVTTQILNKEKEIDTKLLEMTLLENRVIVTHDVNTFPKFAYEKILKGERISGVLIVPTNMPIGDAIIELEIIVTCGEELEFENRVEYLPLRFS